MHDTPHHKIVMIGSAGTGKTSIVLQLQEKIFKKMVTPTVGSGVTSKDFLTPKGVVPLRIWDTAGEERYRSFTGLYSQGSTAAIVVFDVTSHDTFDAVNEWISLYKENCMENALIYLAGNKTDLADFREVSFQKATTFAQQNNLKYFDVSAKSGENIELLFKDLANALGPISEKTTVNQINTNNNGNKCC